jgi:hypothetical protein
VPEYECRVAFGYGALLMDFIFLRGAAWWYAQRHPQSQRGRVLERAADWGIGLMLLPLLALVLVLTKAGELATKIGEKLPRKNAGGSTGREPR